MTLMDFHSQWKSCRTRRSRFYFYLHGLPTLSDMRTKPRPTCAPTHNGSISVTRVGVVVMALDMSAVSPFGQ